MRKGFHMPKVSVIVPVYNGADHLRKHVSGLLKQTLEDIELIFVNDASTDDTRKVLSAISYMNPEKHKIINSDKNRGPGGARNLGIEAASGEYIGFADCDDDVAPTMFERLYGEAEKGSYDIVGCSYFDVSINSIGLCPGVEYAGNADNEKRSHWIARSGYVYSNIYKRELFRGRETAFRENVILEDADFLTYMFATAGSFGRIEDALYRYNAYEDSTSRETDMRKYSGNILMAMQAVYDRVSGLPHYPEIQEAVEYFITYIYLRCIKQCLALLKEKIAADHRRKLEAIVDDLISLKKKLAVIETGENRFFIKKMEEADRQIVDIIEKKGIDQCLRYVKSNTGALELQ